MISIGFLWIYWYLNAIFITSYIVQNSTEYLWTVLTESWCSLLLCLLLCICWLIWRKKHIKALGLLQKYVYKLVEQEERKVLYQNDEVEWKTFQCHQIRKWTHSVQRYITRVSPQKNVSCKISHRVFILSPEINISLPAGIGKANYILFLFFIHFSITPGVPDLRLQQHHAKPYCTSCSEPDKKGQGNARMPPHLQSDQGSHRLSQKWNERV